MMRPSPILILCLAACSSGGAPAASSASEAPAPAKPSAAQPSAAQPSAAQPTSQPTSAPAAAAAPMKSSAGGLRWEAPAPFAQRAPKSRMRAAEYGLPGDAGEGELTVYYFGPGQGGSVQANMDRWIGQFTQPDGSDSKAAAKIAERKVGDLKVTTLDLTGTFDGGMAPMMQKAPAAPMTDHRVLGAIAEGPQGPVFFKLVGPAATLGSAEQAFEGLVGSLEPAQ